MSSSRPVVYLGSYTQPHPLVPNASGAGIVVCDFDPRTGTLEPKRSVEGILNPSHLALDDAGTHVLAASENLDGNGSVHAFRRERDGNLTATSSQPSGGRSTCHVCLAPSGLVCASTYTDGVLSVYRFANGKLGPAEKMFRYSGQSANTARQQSSSTPNLT